MNPDYREMKKVAEVCGVSEITILRRLQEWKKSGMLPDVYLRRIINGLDIK